MKTPGGYGFGRYDDIDDALQVLDDAIRLPGVGTEARAADVILDIGSWRQWKRSELGTRLTEPQREVARRIAIARGFSIPGLMALFRAAA